MKKIKSFTLAVLLLLTLVFNLSACSAGSLHHDMTPHELVEHEAKAPTCFESGWGAYVDCSICNYSTYKMLPALLHNYVSGACEHCGVFESSGKLVFRSNGDGTCELTGMGSCRDSWVVIPSLAPEGIVVGIGSYAFAGNNSLTKVTIPPSIKYMDERAFGDCYDLTEVHISDLAAWCTIEFSRESNQSNPIELANDLYLNGELVTELVIPEGTTHIGYAAFPCAYNITSAVIPASVEYIDDSAFVSCHSLSVIKYCGTEEQWNNMSKGKDWDYDTRYYDNIIFNYTVE